MDYLKSFPQHLGGEMQIRKIAFRLQCRQFLYTKVADSFEAAIRGMQQWVQSK
jgi:hypothetical protein